MSELTDHELLAELGVPTTQKPARARTPREERILAGFEDIVRFREKHGRAPLHGEDRDIFERIYAVRLDRLRAQDDCRALLRDRDTYGLLAAAAEPDEALDDEALLAALGAAPAEIGRLQHVTSRAEKREADQIAERTPCADFASYKPRFDRVQRDMQAGLREARVIDKTALAEIQPNEFFVVGGQMALVAGTQADAAGYDKADRRLRVIYDNGTESDVLARSFQKALYRDDASRRITNPQAGPLFGDTADKDDIGSGTIYVLRSHSTHPLVATNRELVHKIGVTNGSVKARISGAPTDPTYLLAPVEIVAEYALANIDRRKLEALLHRVFGRARLEIEIADRFGQQVRVREWFLVPLPAIDKAVLRVRDGSIVGCEYNPQTGDLEDFSGPRRA